MGTTSSITMQSLGKIVQRAPAVGAKTWCLYVFIGRMPRSGKLPVLFLLTGQKSGFSPRRGDSLHRFNSNFAVRTDTWVRLAVQNFTSIGADGWECGPQNMKNFHFLVKSRPVGMRPPKYQKFPLFGKESPRRGDSLDRFPKFLGAFKRLTILR